MAEATEAADALLTWLHDQPSTSIPREDVDADDNGTAPIGDGLATEEAGRPEEEAGSAPAAPSNVGIEARPARPSGLAGERPGPAPDAPVRDGPEPASRRDAEHDAPPLRPAHTDWLHHRLAVSGPAGDVAAFRVAAAGAGTIPWQLDLDRLEEDWFHLLLAPPPPQRRSLSLPGARVLAGQLREAVARRHELAIARVGRSRACPLDLHALLPVPERILRLGPDHADALAWLWEHWGTTQALLHVAESVIAAGEQWRRPTSDDAGQAPVGEGVPGASTEQAALHLTFWSADWTPWRALATVAERWPALRFDARPSYEPP